MYYRLLTLTLLQLHCYFINTQELSLLDPEKFIFTANKHGQRGGDIEDIERRSKVDNNFIRLGRSGRFDTDDFTVVPSDDLVPINYFARMGRGGGDNSEDAFVRLGKSEASFVRLGRESGTRFNGNDDNIIRIGKRRYDEMDDLRPELYGTDMALRRFKRNQSTGSQSTGGKSDKLVNEEIKKDRSNSKLNDSNKKKCPVFVHV